MAQYQTALRTVTYRNSSFDPQTTPRTARFIFDDGTTSSVAADKAIQVIAANNAPTLLVPPPQEIFEDSTLTFSAEMGNAITVADVDADGGVEQLTITPAEGSVSLANSSSLASISNGPAGVLTLRGTIVALNDALDGLRLIPASHFYGASGITIEINDLGNSGVGGAQAASAEVLLQIDPVAHTPAVATVATTSARQTIDTVTISPSPIDASLAGYFRITAITGGVLFEADGLTPISNGQFIPFADGQAGLKFVPTPGSSTAGHLDITSSTTASATGIGGSIIRATIADAMTSVNPVNPALQPIALGIVGGAAPLGYIEPGVSIVASISGLTKLSGSISFTHDSGAIDAVMKRAPSQSGTGKATVETRGSSSFASLGFSRWGGVSGLLPAITTTASAASTRAFLGANGRSQLVAHPKASVERRVPGTLASTTAATFSITGSRMWRELDSLHQQITSDLPLRVWAGSASIVSAGLSVAYFLWLTRGGSLLSSLLSSMPAWKLVDPLPILDHLGNTAAMMKRADDDGLDNMIGKAAGG
jgi:hypothetical protein